MIYATAIRELSHVHFVYDFIRDKRMPFFILSYGLNN